MTDILPPGARTSPPSARNRDPILQAMGPRLPARGLILEIAAGAGEHAVHFARAFPDLQWRPTDPDPDALVSIEAWRGHAGLPNLLPALRLDAAEPDAWPLERADAVVNINMIHISPWTATQGLLAGAARLLPPGGPLCLYGPFLEDGVETAPSNLAFDENLRGRNAEWGIRRLEDVTAVATAQGLVLADRIEMPANNLTLIYRKTGAKGAA